MFLITKEKNRLRKKKHHKKKINYVESNNWEVKYRIYDYEVSFFVSNSNVSLERIIQQVFVVATATFFAPKAPKSSSDASCWNVGWGAEMCLFVPWVGVFSLHCTPWRISLCSSPNCIPLLVLFDVCWAGGRRCERGNPMFSVSLFGPAQRPVPGLRVWTPGSLLPPVARAPLWVVPFSE